MCVIVAVPVFHANIGPEANPTKPADADAQAGCQDVSVLQPSPICAFAELMCQVLDRVIDEN